MDRKQCNTLKTMHEAFLMAIILTRRNQMSQINHVKSGLVYFKLEDNMRNIPFSPPDITEEEINEVVDTLRSGWITTGPKTKQLEKTLTEICYTNKKVYLIL